MRTSPLGAVHATALGARHACPPEDAAREKRCAGARQGRGSAQRRCGGRRGKGGAGWRGGAAAAGAAVDVGGTNGRNLDDGVVVIDQGKEGYL